MARNYGTYSEMNLQKNICEDCKNEFISGFEISKEKGMFCPYCGSKKTYREAITTDENMLEDLGCLSLMIESSKLN